MRAQHLDDFAGGAARGHHVFHHHHGFVGSNREASPERHPSIGIAFREDSSGAQCAGYFMTDNQPADGRRRNHVDIGRSRRCPHAFGKAGAQPLGVNRVLKNEGALEVFRTVQSTGQPEMAFKVGAGFIEDMDTGSDTAQL